jgi:hypothetical protein
MKGALLRFYVDQAERHDGDLVWEWLLRRACKMGIRGGTAFRALAGFGCHPKFADLTGEPALAIEFVVDDDEARQLLALVERTGVRAFYARTAVEFGVINPQSADRARLEMPPR